MQELWSLKVRFSQGIMQARTATDFNSIHTMFVTQLHYIAFPLTAKCIKCVCCACYTLGHGVSHVIHK